MFIILFNVISFLVIFTIKLSVREKSIFSDTCGTTQQVLILQRWINWQINSSFHKVVRPHLVLTETLVRQKCINGQKEECNESVDLKKIQNTNVIFSPNNNNNNNNNNNYIGTSRIIRDEHVISLDY